MTTNQKGADVINRNGLMRLGAQHRIDQLRAELSELESIVRAPRHETTTADDRPREKRYTHWTQDPANAGKLAKMHRKGAKTRRANR